MADVGLGASMSLQGLWVLQTGLSLYVEVFIPEGCHKLLDVVSGVEGSTKCDKDESRFRAVAILDLVFLIGARYVRVADCDGHLCSDCQVGWYSEIGFLRGLAQRQQPHSDEILEWRPSLGLEKKGRCISLRRA